MGVPFLWRMETTMQASPVPHHHVTEGYDICSMLHRQWQAYGCPRYQGSYSPACYRTIVHPQTPSPRRWHAAKHRMQHQYLCQSSGGTSQGRRPAAKRRGCRLTVSSTSNGMQETSGRGAPRPSLYDVSACTRLSLDVEKKHVRGHFPWFRGQMRATSQLR